MIKCGTITVSMTDKFKKKVDDTAKKLGVPRSVLIRKAIVDLMKTQPCKGDFKREF